MVSPRRAVVARWAHNPKVDSSSLSEATKKQNAINILLLIKYEN